MKWFYKNIPLKDYLYSILKDKRELKYLYSTVRRVLAKEYTKDTDLDLLVDDILTRDKIKKIINGEYVKQEKQSWNYHNTPLKDYLASIIKNKDDLDFLYDNVKIILEAEYKEGMNLDLLIENILERDKIKLIIDGGYTKRTEVKWYYKGTTLVDYIKKFIKSEYRSPKKIRQNIEDFVTARIKKEKLSISDREKLIDEYLASNRFKNFLMTPPRRKLNYYYNGVKLYHVTI